MRGARNADWYRTEAARIRKLAEQESNAELRDSYLELSKAYETLAERLDRIK